jgi:hypothetical protein
MEGRLRCEDLDPALRGPADLHAARQLHALDAELERAIGGRELQPARRSRRRAPVRAIEQRVHLVQHDLARRVHEVARRPLQRVDLRARKLQPLRLAIEHHAERRDMDIGTEAVRHLREAHERYISVHGPKVA